MSKSTNYGLQFRPDSYWIPPGPLQVILSGVTSERLRQRIRRTLEEGGELPTELLSPALSGEVRSALSLLHPSWMGGMYLPALRKGEVEIARIVLDSTTQDVYSVRARPSGARICYEIVDEYDTKWQCRSSSRLPLTFLELVQLIDGATFEGMENGPGWTPGSLTDTLRGSAVTGDDPLTAVDFVTVESDFYPELRAYYEERSRQWLKEYETEAEIAQAASDRKQRGAALAERIRAAPDSAGVLDELESAVAAGWTRSAAWEVVGRHARALDPELLNEMLSQVTGTVAVPFGRLMKNPALTEELGAHLLSRVEDWIDRGEKIGSLSPAWYILKGLDERGWIPGAGALLEKLIAGTYSPFDLVFLAGSWKSLGPRDLDRLDQWIVEHHPSGLPTQRKALRELRRTLAGHPSADARIWAAMLDRLPDPAFQKDLKSRIVGAR